MNKVILCGNLVKDMDVKVIKGKTKKADDVIVGRFTLAVNEGYGENKKATFIPITIFNIIILVSIISILIKVEFDLKIKNMYHLFVLITRAMLIANLFILSNYNLSILIVCITIWISTYPISIFNYCRYFRIRKQCIKSRIYYRKWYHNKSFTGDTGTIGFF